MAIHGLADFRPFAQGGQGATLALTGHDSPNYWTVTMARPGPATHAKRQRERAKQEKRKLKLERRLRRKEEKAMEAEAEEPLPPGEDPDIAGIVPGPQPPLEESL